ncbi:hypothetical protein [Nocardia thailandica]|uniref:Secreted protein n=1 Tax=Nocardia thailandica TaxID=257275 RepID=A0ABW6PG31_9NOCA
MTTLKRTFRLGIAVLAVTSGLAIGAGPAAADPATGSSSLVTGSAAVARGVIESFACAVGALSCPIVIPG